MGRKARLKKIRREISAQSTSPPQPETETDPTKFVQHLEKQGYPLQQIERCPDLPDQQIKPQL